MDDIKIKPRKIKIFPKKSLKSIISTLKNKKKRKIIKMSPIEIQNSPPQNNKIFFPKSLSISVRIGNILKVD